MTRCKETNGILFKHTCAQTAQAHCTTCEKPICPEHQRFNEGQPTCIGCVRDLLKDRRTRESHQGTYRDDPYFYFYFTDTHWDDDPYDADDYALFDDVAMAAAYIEGQEEAGWEGS